MVSRTIVAGVQTSGLDLQSMFDAKCEIVYWDNGTAELEAERITHRLRSSIHPSHSFLDVFLHDQQAPFSPASTPTDPERVTV
ncbi:hypothetical protein ES702_00591 [subsurface metagenome]